jgi:hypothetical protein
MILCGFLAKDLNDLILKSQKHGLKLVDYKTDNGWLQTQFIK